MNHEKDPLQLFIHRLDQWDREEPPTRDEWRRLEREAPLTETERNKLDLLIRNHVFRARRAAKDEQYALALAEINRAVHLSPRDPAIRVQLAEIFLERSLNRGYSRKDRQKAVEIAETALRLQPLHPDAVQFLRDYKKMDYSFKKANRRHYWIIPAFVLLIAAGFLFRKEWIFLFFPNRNLTVPGVTTPAPDIPVPPRREVETEVNALSGSPLETQIISAAVGRRLDGSWVALQGRVTAKQQGVEKIVMEVRGVSKTGLVIFSFPWVVQDQEDAPMRPGDTLPLNLFRWLGVSEAGVDRLEIFPQATGSGGAGGSALPREKPILWEAPRPEGVRLVLWIREIQLLEAYDRQILRLDLGVENVGREDLELLETEIILGSPHSPAPWVPLKGKGPPLASKERRPYRVFLPMELDTPFLREDLVIKVTGIAAVKRF